MNILVTRPEPGASITAARLQALGHQPILAPSLKITLRAAALPEAAAIIITSGQAIAALPASSRHLPVFCVGDATAGRLREAGFVAVESASGNADDLYRLITARGLPGTHLMAVGERHGLALARKLRAAHIPVIRRAVYGALPIRALPATVRTAMAGAAIHAALFYSAESARAFLRLNPPGTAGIEALALSPAVATALHGLPWRAIRVASAPTEADLMALLK